MLTRRRIALSHELLASAAVGLILLGFGLPRLIAGIAAAPAARVQELGRTATPADLAVLAESDAAALRWVHSGRRLKQLGLAQAALVDHATGGAAAVELRDAARQNLKAGLALSPADPAAWAALAEVDFAEGAASSLAPRALVLSLLTGPNEPAIFWRRLDLCLGMWPSIAASDRAPVMDQLRRAWLEDPRRLADLARRRDAAEPVRAALEGEPAAIERFKTLMGEPASPG